MKPLFITAQEAEPELEADMHSAESNTDALGAAVAADELTSPRLSLDTELDSWDASPDTEIDSWGVSLDTEMDTELDSWGVSLNT